MSRTGCALALLVATTAGCGGGAVPASTPADKPPAQMPAQFRSRCDAEKAPMRPLVVEWPAPDRAALEASAHRGQLVVKYEGCALEVLRACTAPASFAYKYLSITPKDELVTMSNADELYASIPVYAANFEGKLSERGQLSAAMTIVGTYESASMPPALDELQGDCDGATHVVSALIVGAFEFFAGQATEAGAQAKVLGAGAGAEHQAKHETLSRDGNVKSCAGSKRGDGQPPDACGALLRLELAKIRPAGAGLPTCEPGQKLVGRECKPIEKPAELAPEDASFVDDKAGFGWGNRCYTHFKNGALKYARAACQKGLDAGPDANTRAAILYNMGLVNEAAGDVKAACESFRLSLASRPGIGQVQKKYDALECVKLMGR